MDVHFDPQTEAELSRIAAEQGPETEAVVQEAVERLSNHERWFQLEVARGIAAADAGELVEHDEVRKIIDRRFSG